MRPINSAAIVFASALVLMAGSSNAFDQGPKTSNEPPPQMCADQSSFVVAAAEKEQAPAEKEQAPSGDVQERAIPRPPIGGPPRGVILSPRPGGPVAASTDVSCSNGKKFSITTGTKQGKCDVHIINGKVTGGQWRERLVHR